MKYFSLYFLGAILVAFTGCESVRSKVENRFASPVYQSKIVSVDQHKAFEVARAALARMNFTYEGGGPAQGKIRALGPMHPSPSAPGTARQISADVKLSPGPESGTMIEILFSEMVEDDFNKRPGLGELTPLRDAPIYEVFFSYVDGELGVKP
jgi:hypothetical protein